MRIATLVMMAATLSCSGSSEPLRDIGPDDGRVPSCSVTVSVTAQRFERLDRRVFECRRVNGELCACASRAAALGYGAIRFGGWPYDAPETFYTIDGIDLCAPEDRLPTGKCCKPCETVGPNNTCTAASYKDGCF